MSAKNRLLKLLSIKSRSIAEARKKLSLKGYPEEEIEEAIEACRRLGYLNDAEESGRRQEKWKRRGYGPHIVAYKLKEAGLKYQPVSRKEQASQIRELLQKPLWKKKPREKKIAALQRRGFNLDLILELIL